MEVKMMYRIKFKNGEYTPWSFDRSHVEKTIQIVGGKLETKLYNPPIFKGLK